MQFTSTIISTILALAASSTAIPTSVPIPTITLKIYNDMTGASATASIPADGVPHFISDLFRGSAISSASGDILGTSAQLTGFQDLTKCQLVNLNIPGWTIDLDGRAKNFVDLDGDVTKPIPTWLNGFTFHCVKPQ
ncbi:hypothetical protein CFE70_001203 [Pyrenophora teres f. teres 0-1]|uniref:Uncharacterized protein n=2 Tax=Pyrenophora teres f. teres TaxID=97479 RepID=E3S4B8_PYRTT|nr:hypothetical protein PTT_17372 [Pyrenophora teres f. teres 0-1]KAE8822679.1 hypothetical protein HRS9139_10019 [Pyrenophora teres f. teres]KAE8826191.1 hypothetical protein PTNB85_09136 [Pyrenophora teres f. teres]KAE8832797.1 hypothetical protein HRS9122_08510 [Pyrenophora teres f. teres]KAE8852749.1 hypothetical protein PTNB29_10139 [Pyrenophora teres f. teres]